jgi:hypothetical protein
MVADYFRGWHYSLRGSVPFEPRYIERLLDMVQSRRVAFATQSLPGCENDSSATLASWIERGMMGKFPGGVFQPVSHVYVIRYVSSRKCREANMDMCEGEETGKTLQADCDIANKRRDPIQAVMRPLYSILLHEYSSILLNL